MNGSSGSDFTLSRISGACSPTLRSGSSFTPPAHIVHAYTVALTRVSQIEALRSRLVLTLFVRTSGVSAAARRGDFGAVRIPQTTYMILKAGDHSDGTSTAGVGTYSHWRRRSST